MSLLQAFPGLFAGIRIIQDIHMTDPVDDWSQVRSPARAKRRLKRGFRQRIRTIHVPKKSAYSIDGGKTLVMHPETFKALQREADKDQEQRDTEKWLREHGPSKPDMASP